MRRCSLAAPKIKAFHCPHAVLALTTAFPPGSQAGERSGRDTLSPCPGDCGDKGELVCSEPPLLPPAPLPPAPDTALAALQLFINTIYICPEPRDVLINLMRMLKLSLCT